MIPNLNEICDCCGGNANQPVLQVINNCFSITDGKDILGQFCLNDFGFPTDGHTCIGINVDSDHGTKNIFNNELLVFSPAGELISGKAYARGILLKIIYPTTDNNGEDIILTNKNVILSIETYDGNVSEYPLYNFFSIFTNPKSNEPSQLINKIDIINPNTDYSIRISALVLFGNAE
jgi:hypothetical protein